MSSNKATGPHAGAIKKALNGEDNLPGIKAILGTFGGGVLTGFGDNLGNSIVFSRDAAGTILLNGGGVQGGTPTVANTNLIQAFGLGGDDTISLSETNGALPRANLFGGSGNDVLTGGSSGDILFGQGDNDTLLGQGGVDFLFGGAGNDVLTGGDSDDQMFGEAGDDRLIWNPGDDTDLHEGGAGTDTTEVNGGNGKETFTVTANGSRVRFDRLDPAPFSIDMGTMEKLEVNMNGGDDVFSATGNLAALLQITVDGGAGNDTILGSNGNDTLIGGEGDDFIDGQQGNDVALLGAGNDVFQWDPGDGSDVVEGGAGADTMLFNGSAGNEAFALVPNGGRALFTRNLGNIVMDLNDVETVTVNALGGADTLNVGDMSDTEVTQVNVNLAGTLGGAAGDGMTDVVTVHGSGLADFVDVLGGSAGLFVLGSPATVAITNVEPGNDILEIKGGGGGDRISAASMNAGLVRLNLSGEAGDDEVFGSRGADILGGGEGNDFIDGEAGDDVALLGEGDDIFRWEAGDGNDVVEGQAGRDVLLFNQSGASEAVNIVANGGRVLMTRDVGNVVLDLHQMEKIDILAQGGADNFVVGDLAGTGLAEIAINLGAVLGTPQTDGAADSATTNGSQAADVIAVSGKAGSGTVKVDGPAADVTLTRAEAALDRLTINGLGGDDVIDATALDGGVIGLTINGGLGNDVMLGSAGGDLISGGDGNDVALTGAGDDTFVWNPGDDNDVIEGQAGQDRLVFNGSNAFENFILSANGGRVLLNRSLANVVMDLNDVETVEINALGGPDEIVVNDLTGTEVTEVKVNLGVPPGSNVSDGAGDVVEVKATNGANSVQVSGSAGNLAVTGLAYQVNVTGAQATSEILDIDLLGGDDVFSAASLAAGSLEALGIDGGDGNDTILGSQGVDFILGGAGNDIVTGGRGDDHAILEEGDDTFIWNPGEGNDVIEGGEGTDQMLFFGSDASETINMSTHLFTRLLFTRDIANVTMDTKFVEDVVFRALGGPDNIVIGDLAATDVETIEIDLRGAAGGGDGEADTVTATGTAGADVFGVTGDVGGVRVFGLGAQIDIFQQEAALDRLVLNAGSGDDVVDASSLEADGIQLTINGGLGNDVLLGSEGDDLVIGGDGNDIALMGAGDDRFVWNPGDDNDVLEGQAGFDTMVFNGSNASENVNIVANGGRVLFTRDVANVVMDLDDMESIDFSALGGADTITISDLSGTDVSEINLDLALGGAGDGQADTIVINATNGDDVVLVVGDNGGLSVLGLAAQVNVTGFEAGLDRIVINALGGDDVVEASGLTFAGLTADGGGGDDVLVGGDAADILLGGLGDDVLVGGGGLDVLDGGAGDNVIIQGPTSLQALAMIDIPMV